jgi:hypothetical protein
MRLRLAAAQTAERRVSRLRKVLQPVEAEGDDRAGGARRPRSTPICATAGSTRLSWDYLLPAVLPALELSAQRLTLRA